MATTTPALGGQTLAEPAADGGYKEELFYRGASVLMADGSIKIDLVQSTAKLEFTLKWTGITTAQRTTIETAFATIKTSFSSNNFTAPTGTQYTVTRHPSQDTLDWDSTMIAGNTLRWGTSMKLREV